jgi:peptidoglycan/LPS O-acetylase OafA/YrhL
LESKQGTVINTSRQYRNFDQIRLAAAVGVIFSHSFLIAEGSEEREPLQFLTGEILGIYGVYSFFILSGFLITRSALTSTSLVSFAWKRVIRIYPAYMVSGVVCFLLVVPIFAVNFEQDYFFQRQVWMQAINFLILGIKSLWIADDQMQLYELYSGRLGSTLNGVLWTIQAEVQLYFLVLILAKLRLLNLYTCGALALVGLYMLCSNNYLFFDLGSLGYYDLWGLTFGIAGFFSGAFCYFLFYGQRPDGRIALIFIGLIICSALVGLAPKLYPLLAAYPLLWLGSSSAPQLGSLDRIGDLSYGVYVFGWPVQQLVYMAIGPGNGFFFFLLCLPPILFFAWLSWTLVERPALNMRHALAVISK